LRIERAFDTVVRMIGVTELDAAPTLGEQVAALTADLHWLGDRELAARLQQLERLARQVEHAIVATVTAAHVHGAWIEDGHRSVRGWCQATVNWSGAETTHRLRTARLVDRCDAIAMALAAGDVGVTQVRELARAHSNTRCGDGIAIVEELLLADAQHLPYDAFREQVRSWEQLADVDGAHHDHELIHESRRASLRSVGDGYELRGECGAAQGAAMAEILEAFADAEFHADVDEARQRLGLDPDTPLKPGDLARSARQRRWDALYAIFLAATTNPGATTSVDPVVDIVVDQATFEAAIRAMTEHRPLDEVMPPVTDPHSRRCHTLDGVPLDPCDAVTASIIGRVRRVVFGAKSCTIDLGIAQRLFRGGARLAVWLQDGTRCIWPGCGRRHTQIDHATPVSECGPTRPDNGDPLCPRHNRWKTRGYATRRDDRGHWHLYRPDGTEIRPI
jgi:hypothetical protein